MDSLVFPTSGARTGLLESNHISIKLPRFFDVTVIWFSQIETIFWISNITKDSTKFFTSWQKPTSSKSRWIPEILQQSLPYAYEELKA